MKEFIFITDFDGTLTKKDFYEILLNKYNPNLAKKLENEWQKGRITVFEFLQKVFNTINISEEELYQDILSIEFDDYFNNFIDEVKNAGGDIVVLSAGTTYYIERLFEHKGIHDITIYSNPGVFKENGLYMTPDKDYEFYSTESGIDKALVVKSLMKNYKKIYYAGDGSPDFKAAKQTDIIFARSVLQKLCEINSVPYIPYDSFADISNYLKEIGVFSNEKK